MCIQILMCFDGIEIPVWPDDTSNYLLCQPITTLSITCKPHNDYPLNQSQRKLLMDHFETKWAFNVFLSHHG